ncbi:cytochrome c oxidase subunit 4 [Streptomyces sp. NPDC047315]|uniref:aa3-type cytochrome oxidase subunit IV n=1 Tax=Streptomyces sp. NPDC047315 TaxID=3155142 RepID=UPI0033FC1691
MRGEAWLFTATAGFFLGVAVVYGVFAHEPAGLSALLVSFAMTALISAFLWRQRLRTQPRPEDRKDAQVQDTAGRRFSFPRPHSYAPVTAAAGFALLGLGVVKGLWIFLIGVGVLVPGVYGFVFGGHDEAD